MEGYLVTLHLQKLNSEYCKNICFNGLTNITEITVKHTRTDYVILTSICFAFFMSLLVVSHKKVLNKTIDS